ncbi:serine hydrolase [Phytoactinopolyspora limicola]|uniref:serine hydrolase n=1 Tax=Phytoactinopolyspora limicola TaxID=2715536 RepID=UPI00140BDE6E|nr:Cpe/LpqF family protein [Phytoactinopolyspora limicola]
MHPGHPRRRRHRRAQLAVGVLAGCLLVACGSGDDGAAHPPDTDGGHTPTAPATPDGTDTHVPATPAGEQVTWVLRELHSETGPDADTAEERFSEAFLDEVPAPQVALTFNGLRQLGPFTVVGYEGSDDAARVQLSGADDTGWLLTLLVDDDGRIGTLTVAPHDPPPEIATWAEVDELLTATGADVGIYAARDHDGTWQEIHSLDPATARPLGSTAKLYVLGAVQQAVLDGEIAWDDELVVTDDVRSLPTGQLQDAAEGTLVSVADAAEKMISISDNTATDLLIDLVGRDAVEAAAAAMGHHQPDLLEPFITTRELFHLAWSDPRLRDSWSDADAQRRGDLLDAVPPGALGVAPADITDVAWTAGVDWFASATDVAAAHLGVQVLAAEDSSGITRNLLALNPGVAVDGDVWPYAAYKGGSAPGVFVLSWYLEDADDVPHVLIIQLAANSAADLADELRLVRIAEQALDLLAQ